MTLSAEMKNTMAIENDAIETEGVNPVNEPSTLYDHRIFSYVFALISFCVKWLNGPGIKNWIYTDTIPIKEKIYINFLDVSTYRSFFTANHRIIPYIEKNVNCLVANIASFAYIHPRAVINKMIIYKFTVFEIGTLNPESSRTPANRTPIYNNNVCENG